MVDTYFVGQLGGSLSMGLGIGTSSVISRAIGGSEDETVRCLTTDSLLLSLLLVGVFITLGWLTIDPLFTVMGAGANLLPLIRATGDTLTPSEIVTVAGVANIVLDPLLIFGYGFVPAICARINKQKNSRRLQRRPVRVRLSPR